MTTKKKENSKPLETSSSPRTVYQLIAAVSRELALIGIGKLQRNTQQGTGYYFRGIDDVYNVVGPVLAKHGLVILPRVLRRECTERTSTQGKALFWVVVEMEFTLISSEDGSSHTVVTYGEAMDSGDKATNKAMSAAYKYAIFQTFCIPTEGDNDADASTHTVTSHITKPEPIKTLDTEQIETIKKLANSAKVDISAILKFYKASTLEEIAAVYYNNIIRFLEKKIQQKEVNH